MRWALLCVLAGATACGSGGDTTPGGGPDAGPSTLLCPDGQAVCECSSDDECGARAVCSSVGSCECAPGYEEIGDGCAWRGLENPSFADGQTGWELVSPEPVGAGLEFRTEAEDEDGTAYVNPGAVFFREVTFPSVSQTIEMPPRDKADQFVVSFRYRVEENNNTLYHTDFAFAVNGRWTFPITDRYPEPIGEWRRARVCLGEIAYGGPVTFEFSRSHIGLVNAFESLEVDFFRVELASPVDNCPEPGIIENGDFESTGGFEPLPGLEPSANGTAEIRNTGGNGHGFLESIECRRGASLENLVSIPDAPLGQGWAIELTHQASADNVLFTVGVGGREYDAYFDFIYGSRWRNAGSALAGTTPETTRFCVPRNHYGTVQPFGVSLRSFIDNACDEPIRSLEIDNVSLVSVPECGELDYGFEYPSAGNLASQWMPWAARGASVVADESDARTGLRALHISLPSETVNGCALTTLEGAWQMPPIQQGTRAAIRGYFKTLNTTSGSYLRVEDAPFLVLDDDIGESANFSPFEVCLRTDPSGRPVSPRFFAGRDDCSLGSELPTAEYWLDDLEIVVINAGQCPAPLIPTLP